MIKKYWEFINEDNNISNNDMGILCITFKDKYLPIDSPMYIIAWKTKGYNIFHKWDSKAGGAKHISGVIICPVDKDKVETLVKQVSSLAKIDKYDFIPTSNGNELMKYILDGAKLPFRDFDLKDNELAHDHLKKYKY
jgi:hypothetical protein